jgi:glutamate carboxypeptidase
MTDCESGITVNVGVVRGGTRLNVVPAFAEAEIDLRARTLADAARLSSLTLGRRPSGRRSR